jgi:hypothetical protein
MRTHLIVLMGVVLCSAGCLKPQGRETDITVYADKAKAVEAMGNENVIELTDEDGKNIYVSKDDYQKLQDTEGVERVATAESKPEHKVVRSSDGTTLLMLVIIHQNMMTQHQNAMSSSNGRSTYTSSVRQSSATYQSSRPISNTTPRAPSGGGGAAPRVGGSNPAPRTSSPPRGK